MKTPKCTIVKIHGRRLVGKIYTDSKSFSSPFFQFLPCHLFTAPLKEVSIVVVTTSRKESSSYSYITYFKIGGGGG